MSLLQYTKFDICAIISQKSFTMIKINARKIDINDQICFQ